MQQNERTYRQLHPRESKRTSFVAWAIVAALWLWFALLMAFFILFVGYHW